MKNLLKVSSKKLVTLILLFAIAICCFNYSVLTVSAEPDVSLPNYITNTVVPDGIYAFKNLASSKWLDVQYDSIYPGYHMQQYVYPSSPADRNDLNGLYRVTQIENTGRYVVRLLLNENLTFYYEDDEILTKEIPSLDCEVAIEDTFYIQYFSYGCYVLQQYGSDKYVCCNDINASGSSGAPNSYLIVNNLNSAGDKAKWRIEPYQQQIKTGAYWISNDVGIASGANPRIMDAEGPSYAQGTPIQQWKGSNPEQNNMYYAQVWIVRNIGCGYYTISSSRKLDMYMSCNGTSVTLKECNDSEIGNDSTIQWKIEGNMQSGYTITSKYMTDCIITAPDSTLDGRDLVYSDSNESSNGLNRWDFNRIDNVYIASIYSATVTSGSSLWDGGALLDFGHSWIKFENLSTNSVTIGDVSVGPNEHITVGKWGNQTPARMWYNLERHFSANMTTDTYGGYISILIRNDKLQAASIYISTKHDDLWLPFANCSHLAMDIWGIIAGSEFANTSGNPDSLLTAMKLNACYVDGSQMIEGDWCGYYKDNKLYKSPYDDIKIKDLPTPNNQNSATIDADSSVTYETESEIFSSVNEQYIGDNEYD